MTSTSSPDSSSSVPSAPIQNVPVTVDSKGRVRVSKAQRELILAEFERSGVSGAQFAQRTGLKYSTLAGWLQRYRRAKSRRCARSVRLLEAVVAEVPSSGDKNPLVLELPGGAKVQIVDARQAALAAVLLRTLAGPC
jgi:lambda repressor-like predicted transcriptional regulator